MANRMRRINVTAASSAASGPRAMRRGLVVLSMLGFLVAGVTRKLTIGAPP
jgi:hypothetical protein